VLVDVGQHHHVERTVGEVQLVRVAGLQPVPVRREARLLEGGVDPDPLEVGELRVAVGRYAALAADVERLSRAWRGVRADQLGQRLGEDPVTDIPLLVGLQERFCVR
jgi:hypothetical protein